MDNKFFDSDNIINNMVSYLKQNKNILAIALGGSRTKQYYTSRSDYDLFCVINSDEFEMFREEFNTYLESCIYIQYSAEFAYVENWGYIFKTIYSDNNLIVNIDISIIPLNRIGEMSLRSTNICLFDRINCIEQEIKRNIHKSFDVNKLEPKKLENYVKLFGFEVVRFKKCIKKKDYWFAVRCLERMKTYYIRCIRILNNLYSKHQECPEKNFLNDFPLDVLCDYYKLDGTYETLELTCDELIRRFQANIPEKEIIDYFLSI